ncbi:hypothetical protein GOBAR_DD34286 [Gossypium barbadense]|nr:hypothetical protein GOBAR_DD34286 [Gossypium barbadense]
MAIPFRPYSTCYSDTFVWLKFDCRIIYSVRALLRVNIAYPLRGSEDSIIGFCVWADLCVVENMEKLMSKTELSKEMYTFPAVHPSNCGINEAPINNDVNAGKGETSSTTVVVAIPIADS